MDALLISIWGLITGTILLVSFNGNDKSETVVKDPEPVVVQLNDDSSATKDPIKKEKKKKEKKESKWRKRRKAVSESQPILFKQTLRSMNSDVQESTMLVETVQNVVDEAPAEKEPATEIHAVEESVPVEPMEETPKVVEELQETIIDESPSLAPTVKLPKGIRAEQLMLAKDGTPVRHKLKSGETLTDIAHHYYEDAIFWPYIYEVNKSRISSPNKLQQGMLLYLPSKSYYKINGNSTTSVNKAKALIAKYQK